MDQFGVNPHEVIALCEYLNCTNDPFVTYEELMINGGPKRGDILEISRNGYQHFVLYDEEGICYHVAVTGDAKSKSTTADILCQHLKEITEDSGMPAPSKVRVNNLEKHVNRLKLKPKENEKIFQDLESKVGEKVPYEIGYRNCEYCNVI